MNDVLMIVHTMASLEPNDNDRYTYLANLLFDRGANIEVVTSDFEHHKKAYRDKNVARNYTYKFTFLHENQYSKNISIRRIIGHFSFALRLKKYLKIRVKPDVIYCALPPTISAKVAAKYAKKYNIKFVIDIQDLWPESFYSIMRNSRMAIGLLTPLRRCVDFIYSNSDVIIGVSDTYTKRALSVPSKRDRNGVSVYLGTDIDGIQQSDKYNFADDLYYIAYVGNLGTVYDFENVFLALNKLENDGIRDIRFLIIGDGNQRVEVEKFRARYFANTEILGYLPYGDMFSILKKCDVAINPFKKGVANSVVNKVADYAAAGIPVINTQECEEYRSLLEEYNAGINTIPEDYCDIAKNLLVLYRNKELGNEMGQNNKKLFIEKFDRKNSYYKIVDSILD